MELTTLTSRPDQRLMPLTVLLGKKKLLLAAVCMRPMASPRKAFKAPSKGSRYAHHQQFAQGRVLQDLLGPITWVVSAMLMSDHSAVVSGPGADHAQCRQQCAFYWQSCQRHIEHLSRLSGGGPKVIV